MIETNFDVKPNAVVQLGENLYKNTYGVLIEYITNSYDADASYVKINIDRNKGTVVIEDDGIGMSLEELNDNFLKVGNNRRKKYKSSTTSKGRLVTGRKGFGKLACFGLFESFRVDTFKNNQKSSLIVTSEINEDDEYDYHAMIDTESTEVNHLNGTTIYLSRNTKDIVDDTTLAESIAKRLNIMYDGTHDDPTGFIIYLEDIVINQSYRSALVLNHDIRFAYKIPEDIHRFTKNREIIDYIEQNKITGTIIAREKTVKAKGNKGIVLFARGKLCQEATYLNIQQSNSYGYAHLYAEFHVDFIDGESKDNIGTDRTALNETSTTIELFKVLEAIIRAYGTLYDEDAKKRDNDAVEEFKEDELYITIKQSINSISNEEVRKELLRLFDIQIRNSIKDDTINLDDFNKFQMLTSNITPTKILQTEQIFKNDAKDNITTSYDALLDKICKKYGYSGKDGDDAFNNIYSDGVNYAQINALVKLQNPDTQKNIKASIRELGKAIVAIRNATIHSTDRKCFNETISKENSKRFLILVDLFLEMDGLFYENK